MLSIAPIVRTPHEYTTKTDRRDCRFCAKRFHRYESHLSALAMLAGFAVDNVFFKRIDIPSTQAVFTAYIAVAAASIVFMQGFEARAVPGQVPPKWRVIFPVLAQFSLGGLWSGFLIFYGRSATLAVSWPFVALLVAILVGNEIFRRHLSRLIFSAILLFFAMFSYAIFMVPIYAHAIGTLIFLIERRDGRGNVLAVPACAGGVEQSFLCQDAMADSRRGGLRFCGAECVLFPEYPAAAALGAVERGRLSQRQTAWRGLYGGSGTAILACGAWLAMPLSMTCRASRSVFTAPFSRRSGFPPPSRIAGNIAIRKHIAGRRNRL